MIVRAAGLAVAALMITASAFAAWPEKPIRVVVPFAAGGTSDQMGRVFARAIDENKLLPQPVNIFNVTGHYSVGSRQIKDAAPDGHNFLLVHIALMGGEASGVMDFGFRDFKGVAATGDFCLAPVVKTDSPYKSLKELLEAAKREPGTIQFGVNIAAINHLVALQIQQTTPGASFRYVQVGGGAENFRALIGGHTQASVLSSAELVNFQGGGQLRPLGYTGPTRHPGLPDIPTLKELGYDVDFCVANWWFAPKNTPQPAVDAFADALRKAQQTAYVQKELADRLFASVFLAGAELDRSLAETWKRIEPIAKMATTK
jgi:tripartite-type tricarboxylate transporter receptor subunit TctC